MDIKKFFTGKKTIIVEDDDKGTYGAVSKDVVWVGGTGNPIKIAKAVMTVLIFAIIAALGLYTALGSTLIRLTPETTGGYTLVRNGTFLSGNPLNGDMIYVSNSVPNDGSMGQRLKYSFSPLPDAATLETIAGPFGEITLDEEGYIVFNGEGTEYHGQDQVKPRYLGNEFLALCVSGDCTPGDIYTIPKDNIHGEAMQSFGVKTADTNVDKE